MTSDEHEIRKQKSESRKQKAEVGSQQSAAFGGETPSDRVIPRCHENGAGRAGLQPRRDRQLPLPLPPPPLRGRGDHEVVGEGPDGGAKAPPFQDSAATSTPAIFMHGGEPKDHEVCARNDMTTGFLRTL